MINILKVVMAMLIIGGIFTLAIIAAIKGQWGFASGAMTGGFALLEGIKMVSTKEEVIPKTSVSSKEKTVEVK